VDVVDIDVVVGVLLGVDLFVVEMLINLMLDVVDFLVLMILVCV